MLCRAIVVVLVACWCALLVSMAKRPTILVPSVSFLETLGGEFETLSFGKNNFSSKYFAQEICTAEVSQECDPLDCSKVHI